MMSKGYRRKGKATQRDVDGFLLLDKPPGFTSNASLQKVKKIYSVAKAGHTGSLDPLATGVLPLCFGQATKFSQFLLEANKRYLATIVLGTTTETGDADGRVLVQTEVPQINDLNFILEQFRGEITQTPSMYSALKLGGQPLYKLARAGIEVERKPRKVRIFKLELVKHIDEEVVLDICCSKGTYIRSLAEDIGSVIGCGAHVSGLRRIRSGPYTIDQTITTDRLERLRDDGYDALDKLLLPISSALEQWPVVELEAITASYFRQGQPVQVAKSPLKGWVRVYNEAREEDGFIGVGEILEDGRVAPKRLVAGG